MLSAAIKNNLPLHRCGGRSNIISIMHSLLFILWHLRELLEIFTFLHFLNDKFPLNLFLSLFPGYFPLLGAYKFLTKELTLHNYLYIVTSEDPPFSLLEEDNNLRLRAEVSEISNKQHHPLILTPFSYLDIYCSCL